MANNKSRILYFLTYLYKFTDENHQITTALHWFFRYLEYQNPENLMEWQRILSIPVKKTEKTTINYLSVEAI